AELGPFLGGELITPDSSVRNHDPILRDRIAVQPQIAPPPRPAAPGDRATRPWRIGWGIRRRARRFALVGRDDAGGRWLGRSLGPGVRRGVAEEVAGDCSLIRTDGSRPICGCP